MQHRAFAGLGSAQRLHACCRCTHSAVHGTCWPQPNMAGSYIVSKAAPILSRAFSSRRQMVRMFQACHRSTKAQPP